MAENNTFDRRRLACWGYNFWIKTWLLFYCLLNLPGNETEKKKKKIGIGKIVVFLYWLSVESLSRIDTSLCFVIHVFNEMFSAEFLSCNDEDCWNARSKITICWDHFWLFEGGNVWYFWTCSLYNSLSLLFCFIHGW